MADIRAFGLDKIVTEVKTVAVIKAWQLKSVDAIATTPVTRLKIYLPASSPLSQDSRRQRRRRS